MRLNTKFPFYIFLLPVFFFLHGLNENFVPELLPVAAWLAFIYIVIAIAFAALAWLWLKEVSKAALLAGWIMAFNFFFGALHDFARSNFPTAFFTRYSFIVPVFIGVTVLLAYWLKKKSKTLAQLTLFLNLLVVVLVAIDGVTLVSRYAEKRSSRDVSDLRPAFVSCDTCARPDIYLIVPDEYANRQALQELSGFDNSGFENELRKRNFHVVDSSVSNYNATIYSMASILSMDYIKNLDPAHMNARDMQVCQQFIRQNNFLYFAKQQGYRIVNHSYFDLDNKKKAVSNPFYPTSQSVFIHQTFTKRLQKDLGHKLFTEKKVEHIIKYHLYNNRHTEELTRATALSNDNTPKFVYVHFEMPHHPYYFDSKGLEKPYRELTDSFTMDRKAYAEYVGYANNRLLQLIDHITTSSRRPPVIILLSDHGFRQVAADVPHRYYFMNLSAVLLPNRNYTGFYPGMSNVNMLRAVVNAQFGQQLPLLKDSTSFLNVPMRTF
jgi:hypothetical protein